MRPQRRGQDESGPGTGEGNGDASDPGNGLGPAQPDFEGTIRRLYGGIVLHRVFESLARREVCEIHYEGSHARVRKKPSLPERKTSDKSGRTGANKKPKGATVPTTSKADAEHEPPERHGRETATARPTTNEPQRGRKKHHPSMAEPIVRVLLGEAPRRDVAENNTDRLKSACWGNKRWNQRVARVAQAFADADGEALRELDIAATA